MGRIFHSVSKGTFWRSALIVLPLLFVVGMPPFVVVVPPCVVVVVPLAVLLFVSSVL